MIAVRGRWPHQAHERQSEHRRDAGWVDEQWRRSSTRVLVVAGSRVETPLRWISPDQAPPGELVLLGEREGRTYFAVLVAPEAGSDGWAPIRSLLPDMASGFDSPAPAGLEGPADTASLVFHALGVSEWVNATRFCPRCGQPLALEDAGHVLACPAGHRQFPRTDPAVIMLISHGEPGSDAERCLLGNKAGWERARFSTLAGFCEPGEALEDAVRREVREEAGVRVGAVTYVGNQPWPLPGSLMLGFTGRAHSLEIDLVDQELAAAQWFTRDELVDRAQSGSIVLPSRVSISRSLIEGWAGVQLPAGF